MNWFVLAIISVVSLSIANIFQRVVMKEEDSNPLASSIIFLIMLGILTGIVAVLHGFEFPPLREYALYFFISSFLYAAGSLAIFKAVKQIEASEFTIISAFGAVVTIVLAILILHEKFTFSQGLGTFCILAAVLLILGRTKLSLKSGALYAVLGSIFYSAAVISDLIILKTYDALSYTSVMSLLPAFLLILYKPSVISQFRSVLRLKYIKNMLMYSGLYGLQAITYYLAIGTGANASQMAPITRSQIILTVLLAAIFLKERDRMTIKIASAILVTIGVYLAA
jgi:bacterial/archaeal transporter family protein